MEKKLRQILEEKPVTASAPCRVDLGGTIDIAVFYYPLSYLEPVTFNIALDMRTHVRIVPYKPGLVKISSAGFLPAEFHIDAIPFSHPMGLLFAIAAYFRIDGIHIEIASSSPPKSALGGSSSAAVAVIAAFDRLLTRSGKSEINLIKIPELAHAIEESTAGVACGCQDQMAATWGGVNAWYWKGHGAIPWFDRKKLLDKKDADWLNDRMLVAYCGVQHDSSDINSQWIRGFIDATWRMEWVEIVNCTKRFIRAFTEKDVSIAVECMNRETAIRQEMTPGVLDVVGENLVAAARNNHCAARFAGAGGGGCIWAFGEPDRISVLKSAWEGVLDARTDARLLDTSVDTDGVWSD